MVVVVMNEKDIDLQSAVDFVGDLCKKTIDCFIEDKSNIPSWGAKIDRDVAVYVDGLANWIFGGLIWSFESERYFAKEGLEVKASRVVQLLPRVSGASLDIQFWLDLFIAIRQPIIAKSKTSAMAQP
jgi:hypothetical protein